MKKAKDLLQSKEKFLIKLGLDRISSILEIMDNPQDNYKIIHIAGTNGKGSSARMISQGLIEQGYKTGLFTSPHIFSYTERIQVNNENISDGIFDIFINETDNLAKENKIELSEFELITAVAFYYFYIKKVDYVVLETGLGGLYDATNVIKSPVASVVTTIDFDHTERLGSTIDEIATQKAGIIKQNCPVFVSKDNLGYKTIENIANEKNAPLIEILENPYPCNLKGDYQKKNSALSYSVLKYLHTDEKNIELAMKNVQWKFRLEYKSKENILIDSAHNPNGIKALREYLDENFKEDKKIFVFGCLKNKDYKKMLDILIKPEDKLCFCEFDYPNSLKFDEVPEKYKAEKFISTEKLPKDALKIFCGSIYMLGSLFKDTNVF